MKNLSDSILSDIIESIGIGDFLRVNLALDNFKKLHDNKNLSDLISDKNFKIQLEKIYYEGLSKCLKFRMFENFKELLNYSDLFDIFVDLKQIPKRFEHLSNLLMEHTQMGDLGNIIEILRFFNEYDLLVKDISSEERQYIRVAKKNEIHLANLKDLFGNISDFSILYVNKNMPEDLSNYLKDTLEPTIQMILTYLDNYSIYGLSIKKIGQIGRFLKKFNESYNNEIEIKKKAGMPKEMGFVQFKYKRKQHLSAPENIFKNQDKILNKNNYNFYSLSMVISGGLGPQGQGFTYSTPEGEVIEICSDQKETKAIIIKYKQFIKQQFLARLEVEIKKLHIEGKIIENILNFLYNLLHGKELINYYKRDLIIKKIDDFFSQDEGFHRTYDHKHEQLLKKISNAIDIILRSIKMIDQFKCRMDLVAENKIKSEEIARLTSLKEKSHYDVLRERIFFKHIVKSYIQILENEKGQIKSKND